jgi:hypothetical protein
MLPLKIASKPGAIAQTENYLTEYYHNSDELRRLLEMAEIAAYCHALTPIKAFLLLRSLAADSPQKRLLWRFIIFDSPPKMSGRWRGMVGAIVIRGGLR